MLVRSSGNMHFSMRMHMSTDCRRCMCLCMLCMHVCVCVCLSICLSVPSLVKLLHSCMRNCVGFLGFYVMDFLKIPSVPKL